MDLLLLLTTGQNLQAAFAFLIFGVIFFLIITFLKFSSEEGERIHRRARERQNEEDPSSWE